MRSTARHGTARTPGAHGLVTRRSLDRQASSTRDREAAPQHYGTSTIFDCSGVFLVIRPWLSVRHMVQTETISPDLSRSALRSLDVIRCFSMARTNLQ
ncbi:hypothetical protein AAFF_G00071610 [Aldrovandia affinis]|uniref:Uncharacterized protein n=1 Tax=Aldrovandia affinis TaxID=143900 RepID=A0AAD7RYX0_9TELE|nr:hypothetical protein AAFF_G00071610 [Aldrovandia affinis]